MTIQTKPVPGAAANHATDDQWALAKFGIGQPVLRTEDPVLVQGQARYTDDINLPGQAFAVVVRHDEKCLCVVHGATPRAEKGAVETPRLLLHRIDEAGVRILAEEARRYREGGRQDLG